jgi:hypothetical protein
MVRSAAKLRISNHVAALTLRRVLRTLLRVRAGRSRMGQTGKSRRL